MLPTREGRKHVSFIDLFDQLSVPVLQTGCHKKNIRWIFFFKILIIIIITTKHNTQNERHGNQRKWQICDDAKEWKNGDKYDKDNEKFIKINGKHDSKI